MCALKDLTGAKGRTGRKISIRVLPAETQQIGGEVASRCQRQAAALVTRLVLHEGMGAVIAAACLKQSVRHRCRNAGQTQRKKLPPQAAIGRVVLTWESSLVIRLRSNFFA